MTTSTYKDFVILLMAIGMVLLVVGHCNTNKKQVAQLNEYDNLVADLETDRLLYLDSIDLLNQSIEAERLALTNRLNGYTKLPTKERIKLITNIDTLVVITDTSACLSIAGIDSVNKLTFHYQSCMIQSEIKDSIISQLNNVVQADSVIIETQKKVAKAQQKAAKIKAIKAAVISGVAGFIFGLVI